MQLTNNNYKDRVASKYLEIGLNATDVKFSTKYAPATSKNPKEAVLLHIDGIILNDNPELAGVLINTDIWPHDNATDKELEAMFNKKTDKDGNVTYEPRELSDAILRFGYYVDIDPLTKEKKETVGIKWVKVATKGSDEFVGLNGGKREFVQV